MIEKITNQNQIFRHKLADKINELVDTVNELHEEAKDNARIRADHEHKIEEFQTKDEEIAAWIAIVSDLRSRVPVVESRVAILEERAENGNFAKNAQDPYAEQRKWIGCVCRFWNFKDSAVDIGVLKAVDNLKPAIPYISDIDCSYAFCEPVKPDSEIIYHGE